MIVDVAGNQQTANAWRPVNCVTWAVALTIWILIAMQPSTRARSAADDEKAVERSISNIRLR